jgi:hypothetical protein
MKRETIENAVNTLINGNKSDFNAWLQKASKLDMLKAIEYYSGNYGKRHEIINRMRIFLEK